MEFFKKHQFKIIAVVLSLLLICIICLFVFPKGGNNDKEDVYYTVTFNSVGGTVVNRQTILEGERITEPITPQKEGYTFLGWYLDGIKYNFNKTVYKDINLVAKWKITSETNENLEEEKDEVEDTDKKEEENTSNNSQPSQNKPTEDKKDNTVGVTGITLDKTSLSLDVGASSTLTATVKPSNATNKKVTWKSSDTSIVTVSNGEVKAVGAGSATITATAGGKSVSCTVTVNKKVTYDYVMEEIQGSAIGQYYLYIRSSEGKNVSGKVNIVYTTGASKEMNVPEGGLIVIKDVISSVDVISVN